MDFGAASELRPPAALEAAARLTKETGGWDRKKTWACFLFCPFALSEHVVYISSLVSRGTFHLNSFLGSRSFYETPTTQGKRSVFGQDDKRMGKQPLELFICSLVGFEGNRGRYWTYVYFFQGASAHGRFDGLVGLV